MSCLRMIESQLSLTERLDNSLFFFIAIQNELHQNAIVISVVPSNSILLISFFVSIQLSWIIFRCLCSFRLCFSFFLSCLQTIVGTSPHRFSVYISFCRFFVVETWIVCNYDGENKHLFGCLHFRIWLNGGWSSLARVHCMQRKKLYGYNGYNIFDLNSEAHIGPIPMPIPIPILNHR